MPSPIEEQFLAAWQRRFPQFPLVTEFSVYNGRYRIDFAHPLTKVAVELDGYEFHSDRDKFTHDRQRDRALQRDGWRVLHFSGREVYQNADACVQEVYNAIAQASPSGLPAFGAVHQPQDHQHNVARPRSYSSRRRKRYNKSRSAAQGCAAAIYTIGILMLALFAVFMMFGGLASLVTISLR